MLLTELFTQPVDYQITHKDSENISARFEVNDNLYILEAYHVDDLDFSDDFSYRLPDYLKDKVWEFEFAMDKTHHIRGQDVSTRMHKLTGSGNAATVFATFLHFVQKTVAKYNIQALVIQAEKEEPSRVKLYDRMVKTLTKQFGWEYYVHGQNEFYVYVVYKDQQ